MIMKCIMMILTLNLNISFCRIPTIEFYLLTSTFMNLESFPLPSIDILFDETKCLFFAHLNFSRFGQRCLDHSLLKVQKLHQPQVVGNTAISHTLHNVIYFPEEYAEKCITYNFDKVYCRHGSRRHPRPFKHNRLIPIPIERDIVVVY